VRLFRDFLKSQPSVQAVHAQTALGNAGKARSFKAFIAETRPTMVETDKAEAPRVLKPIDDAVAHSPFPHDPQAMDKLRPDQVPRFLGAITDPSGLETKTVRLTGLTAMQNRVDPAKVQAARERQGDKPAVVVRHSGRNYIADGHHRLSAAWLNGESTAEVKYLDLTPVDNAVKRDERDLVATWEIPFNFAKADPEQRLIFGWAVTATKDGRLVIDKQDDMIAVPELEKAAYDFVLYSRDHGTLHLRKGTGRLVESMVFTKEKQVILGIDLGKESWWTGFRVDDPEVWERHKRGELPEFSIGGAAHPVEV
jgi:hypothetical protein